MKSYSSRKFIGFLAIITCFTIGLFLGKIPADIYVYGIIGIYTIYSGAKAYEKKLEKK